MSNPKIKKVIDALAEGSESVRNNPSEQNYREHEGKIERAGNSTDWTPIIVVGIILVVCIFGFMAISGTSLAVVAGTSQNNPVNNPVVYVQPTEYIAPAEYVAPKKYPTATPEIARQYAEISNEVYEVNLRKSPGYQSKNDQVDVIVKVPTGATVEIIGGPQYADDLTWWYVSWRGYEGWMADHTGSGKNILVFN